MKKKNKKMYKRLEKASLKNHIKAHRMLSVAIHNKLVDGQINGYKPLATIDPDLIYGLGDDGHNLLVQLENCFEFQTVDQVNELEHFKTVIEAFGSANIDHLRTLHTFKKTLNEFFIASPETTNFGIVVYDANLMTVNTASMALGQSIPYRFVLDRNKGLIESPFVCYSSTKPSQQ